jgi:hypothetical protein
MNESLLYNLVKVVGEEWRSFSEFTGNRRELHPMWDQKCESKSQDWSGRKCSVSYIFIESLLLRALKKYKCMVINVWTLERGERALFTTGMITIFSI